ncbi:hypothetical protein F5Y10DRAFT_148835 [Nemania abortiva]|nr:hypothetical protein F5Y10DRAFT_148835 [Nemania abortiva]
MADQCIVCLDNLDVQQLSPPPQPPPPETPHPGHGISKASSSKSHPTASSGGAQSPSSNHTDDDIGNSDNIPVTTRSPVIDDDNKIAVIQVCGHVLHDSCLREWTGKANSCPICRQAFHLVNVYDRIGGTLISSYKVEDKKQVAEFDPQAWLDENPEEEEETRPCPICNRADHDEVLLLCDSCDAPYHTYCVGLDSVPRGHWFCLECSQAACELLTAELDDSDVTAVGLAGFSDGRSDYLPRTQATMRRARQRARSDEWQGAWGQITGRVWDALNIDLDNHEDDETLHHYRRSQQRSERERREYQRWQQRLNIASRLGAHDVFAENLPIGLPQRVARQPPPQVPPPEESREEKQAWGALEKAMEAEAPNSSSPSRRKRKSRSVTASPIEPPPPERKLKRPRTRRVPTQSEASSSNQTPAQTAESAPVGPSANGRAHSPLPNPEGPSFLSSLLKEVEMSPTSDDENIRALLATAKPSADPHSPVTSPSPSGYSSPRALSMTPPPRGISDRPGSPLSLSSRIEPIYPPANYIATRDAGEHSDSETRPRQQQQQQHHHHNHHHQSSGTSMTLEIRQPRPRRHRSVDIGSNLVQSPEASPTRANLPFEMKESISGIVKDALKPHWKSGHLTADQYASINRDLSHKLYKEVSEMELNEEARLRFEKIATKEVARAVADIKA